MGLGLLLCIWKMRSGTCQAPGQAAATEDWGANPLQPMPGLAPTKQTTRVPESMSVDGLPPPHTWEGQLLCQVKAGLGGGHWYCYK